MDAEFWVAFGFLCFVGIAFYLTVHTKLGAALDTRAQRIRDELDEAERYRKEAEDLLASFESRREAAEKDAAEIVEQAKAEAELIAKEAEEKMADFVKRRTAQAEAKIANAETQALAQVRAQAAEAATAAAELILTRKRDEQFADKLIDDGIADIKQLIH